MCYGNFGVRQNPDLMWHSPQLEAYVGARPLTRSHPTQPLVRYLPYPGVVANGRAAQIPTEHVPVMLGKL
jgi:hypothetical protein